MLLLPHPWRLPRNFRRVVLTCGLLGSLLGCATPPPSNPDNICAIFREHRHWHDAVQDVEDKWQVPVPIPMAIMYQESSFRADARPPRDWFLGVIPLGRKSSAYGYAQAKDETWADYQRETNSPGASRSDFADAVDFMGWYINKAHQVNKVSKWDAYNLYLNYHEGWGGYRRGTHNEKTWLIHVARRVEQRALRYRGQYQGCKGDLEKSGRFLWIF